MNKEEVEIKKIESEIKEIELRIKDRKINNPFLKYTITGIVAGMVFFASWLGIYKEILFKKNSIALEDAKLAHIMNQQFAIENKMKVNEIESQKTELENQIKDFKIKNQTYIEQIKKLQNSLENSSEKHEEYEQAIKNAESTNKEVETQLLQLKFSGTKWEFIADGYSNKITLLANGRILGFGKFNDYWDVINGELNLYTGADHGKDSWTRKWIGNTLTENEVKGFVVNSNGHRYDNWVMKKTLN
jgi:hypothetical protein